MTQTIMTLPTPTATPGPIPQVYLSFSAEINATTTEALIAQLASYASGGLSTVCLLLSTPGGSVMNGMNLYNVMRAMPFELIVHNVGNVDSIGNAIFAAGTHRYACEHSTFMFHGVGFDVPPNTRFEQKQLRELQDSVEADQKRIGDILQERTSLTAEEVSDLFLEARTKDARYAVSRGIVHQVRDVEIPPGTPVNSLVFQR